MSVASDALRVAYDNYARLLVLVTQQVAAPTQAGVDAIAAAYPAAVNAGTAAGTLTPKINYSLDGVNYDWVGFQQFILSQMESLKKLLVVEEGPFLVRSRGVVP